MSSWDQCTECSKYVILLAQDKARKAGWKEIEPPYIFFAFLQLEGCLAATAITEGAVSREKILAVLSLAMPLSDKPSGTGKNEEMLLSEDSVAFISLGMREAKRQRSKEIKTNHLLLGFIKSGLLERYGLENLDFNKKKIIDACKKAGIESAPIVSSEPEGR